MNNQFTFDNNNINLLISKLKIEIEKNNFFKYKYLIDTLDDLRKLQNYFNDNNLILGDNYNKIILGFFPLINTFLGMAVYSKRDIVISQFNFFNVD